MEKKVSVIIVTHNSYKDKAGSIEFVINAYLQQKLIPFEIIVVDNSSDVDNSARLQSFCADKKSVHIVKCNTSIGGARNLGVRHSNGKYIIFNDDDTIPIQDDVLEIVSQYCDNGQYGYGATRLWSPDIKWVKSHEKDIKNAIDTRNWSYLDKISVQPNFNIRAKNSTSLKMLTRSFIGNFGFISSKNFLSVGGFPEYPGYGCEDDAFAFLCYLKLGRPIILDKDISVLHISHKLSKQNLTELESNKLKLEELFKQNSCGHFHISRLLFPSAEPIID